VSRSNYSDNGLLAQLHGEEPHRILPHLQLARLKFSEIVYKPVEVITHVYFPTTSVVSMVRQVGDGTFVEVSVVGNEGLVGLPVFLGAKDSADRAVVQFAGDAWKVPTEAIQEEFNRAGRFHDVVLRYINFLLLHLAQTASCNRHHSGSERLSRWLLMMHDRVVGDSLQMRQEFLAWMLGVTTGTVSLAAIELQDAGLIEYRRGKIIISDRKRLEEKACSCYRIVKGHFDMLGLFSSA